MWTFFSQLFIYAFVKYLKWIISWTRYYSQQFYHSNSISIVLLFIDLKLCILLMSRQLYLIIFPSHIFVYWVLFHRLSSTVSANSRVKNKFKSLNKSKSYQEGYLNHKFRLYNVFVVMIKVILHCTFDYISKVFY